MSSKEKTSRISAFGKLIIAVLLGFAFLWAYPKYVYPLTSRNNAIRLMNLGEYEQAAEIFDRYPGYKDCDELKDLCGQLIIEKEYQTALQLKDSGEYMQARDRFLELGDYKDSPDRVEECETLGYSVRTGWYTDQVEITVNKNLYAEWIYSKERTERETITAKLTGNYVDGVLQENEVRIVFENASYGGTAVGWRTYELEYVGPFHDNSITGKGRLYYAESLYGPAMLIYEGEFYDGAYSGQGTLYQDGITYENGKMKLDAYDRKKLIEGTWENGNIEGEYTRYYSDGTINDYGKCIGGIGNSNQHGITYYDESKEGMILPADYFSRLPTKPHYVAKVPYVGMSEDDIHSTELGTCTDIIHNSSTKIKDKDGHPRTQTVYRFHKNGQWIYSAICLDRKVIEVSDYRNDPKPNSSSVGSWKPQSESDRYDIDRYSNAEDFYDDNIADFFSYEDAETYFNDHKK